MKPVRILIIAAAILLPVAGRWLWFNQGIYSPPAEVAVPDFESKTLPQPDLSTPVVVKLTAPVQPGALVVDMTHSNAVSLAELDPLLQPLVASGHPIVPTDFNLTLGDQLKSASALLIANPLMFYSQSEIDAVNAFTARGGRLLVIQDPTRTYYSDPLFMDTSISGVDIVNQLLAPHNLAFQNDYLYNLVDNEGNFRHIMLEDIIANTLTKGVKRVVFYSTHSLVPTTGALIRGDANTLSSITDSSGDLAVLATSEDGNAVAMGDMTFMTSPYHQVADNQVLIANLADFLLNANPDRDMSVYPFFFTRTVTIINQDDAVLNEDRMEMLSMLQSWISGLNLKVEVAGTPRQGFDALIPIVLPLEDAAQDLLVPFELEFSEGELFGEPLESGGEPLVVATPAPGEETGSGNLLTDLETYTGPTITVPGIGRVPQEGFGLILFDPETGGRNTVILLAADEIGIGELTSILVANSLASCAVHASVAVCPLTGGDDFSDDVLFDDFFEDATVEPEPELEATPVG